MEFRITDASGGVEEQALVAVEPKRPNPRNSFTAKRALDVVVATLGLIFVAPLLLVVGFLVWRQDRQSAIFSHKRYGQDGRVFKCYKLRSMVADADERLQHLLATDPEARREWDLTQKLVNDPRITPLGRFIRMTSIDELPQLFNVLKGDMSLVGPRPISMSERGRYGENFADYCSVRPGITGLWQISGRSNVSYPERVRLDTTYAHSRSFWGDIAIMFKTIPAVLKSDGAC